MVRSTTECVNVFVVDQHSVPDERFAKREVPERQRRHVSDRRKPATVQVCSVAEPRPEAAALPRQRDGERLAHPTRNYAQAG